MMLSVKESFQVKSLKGKNIIITRVDKMIKNTNNKILTKFIRNLKFNGWNKHNRKHFV